jgi:hypothetical protein
MYVVIVSTNAVCPVRVLPGLGVLGDERKNLGGCNVLERIRASQEHIIRRYSRLKNNHRSAIRPLIRAYWLGQVYTFGVQPRWEMVSTESILKMNYLSLEAVRLLNQFSRLEAYLVHLVQ